MAKLLFVTCMLKDNEHYLEVVNLRGRGIVFADTGTTPTVSKEEFHFI